MLKKLILIGVFIGPLALAGILYLSIESDEDRCGQYFDHVATRITQANFCSVDEDCVKMELDHPNYGCGVDALVNVTVVDEMKIMNAKVNENGCRLYLPVFECGLPANVNVARCVNKQCNQTDR